MKWDESCVQTRVLPYAIDGAIPLRRIVERTGRSENAARSPEQQKSQALRRLTISVHSFATLSCLISW